MNMINIVVRKTTGSKILSKIIVGHGYYSMREWAVNHIEENGPFPTPCVVEGFINQIGGGWSKLDSVVIPALEAYN